MADTKISALTAATTPLAGTEVLPIVQGGSTVKVSVANLTAGRSFTAASGVVGGADSPTIFAVKGATKAVRIEADATGSTLTGVDTTLFGSYEPLTIQGSVIPFSIAGTEAARFSTSGNLAFANGKGIDFSATSGTGTSELLADYEEGTWTAVISDGTNNATMQYTTCQYTKVGRQVTVNGFIGTSSLGSCSGALRITGLPFTIPNSFQYYSSAMVGRADQLNILPGQAVGVYGEVNGTFLRLQISSSAAGTSNLTDTQWSADGQILLSFTYFTA